MNLDPIYLLDKRLKETPTEICNNGKSKHICYKNTNELFVVNSGVICKMENIILDPSKWVDRGFIYQGPVDNKDRGCPYLKEGFFNMKCQETQKFDGYDFIYNYYFDGWKYNYENDTENLEELAPNKTIFFISRNQDSPNLYHGGSEFVNTISMMKLLNLEPKDIQIIFLESIQINNDPFYELYKNLISRGGDPIHVKSLKKKYLISSAIHVPVNWDSPCFLFSGIPMCNNPTKTYKYIHELINKYMKVPNFEDTFINDNITFYYPKATLNASQSGINFTKCVTIQWRKVWPELRKKQERILANGPELAEELAKSA